MNNNIFADLHIHTTASDGVLTPTELIEKAAKTSLKVIAITDHDTTEGVAEAQLAGRNNNIEVIPGIELSCGWSSSNDHDASIHILGLFIDCENSKLKELLITQKQQRHVRALEMVNLLEKENLDVTELRQQFENSNKVLGRPHVARFLMEKEYVSSFQDAFNRYISKGKPAYVPKEHLAPEDAINIIHEANGIAILAHPSFVQPWESIWDYLKDMNWDGFEAYYSEHTPTQVTFFNNIVIANNWLATGGSDFHGEYGKHRNRLGKYGLTKELFIELKAKMQRLQQNQ